jgi:hypothetical protein
MLFVGGVRRFWSAGGGDPDHNVSKAVPVEVSSLLHSGSTPTGMSVGAHCADTAEMVCVDGSWLGVCAAWLPCAGTRSVAEAGRPAGVDLNCENGLGAVMTL